MEWKKFIDKNNSYFERDIVIYYLWKPEYKVVEFFTVYKSDHDGMAVYTDAFSFKGSRPSEHDIMNYITSEEAWSSGYSENGLSDSDIVEDLLKQGVPRELI